MNRNNARKAAEVMLAYADGKEVGYINSQGEWQSCLDPAFNWGNKAEKYHTKPTLTYRPFANVEECWEEMKKHEPFGWLKDKGDGHYISITRLCDTNAGGLSLNLNSGWNFENLIKFYTFADGSVFGKLTEEE